MYNYALNECNIIKKVYTSHVTQFSSRASPPKIRVSSEISVLYCLSNKYFKAIFKALNAELPLIAVFVRVIQLEGTIIHRTIMF